MDEIRMAFEDRQFREIISVGTNMTNFAKLERFSEYRPKGEERRDPKAWWRYVSVPTVDVVATKGYRNDCFVCYELCNKI